MVGAIQMSGMLFADWVFAALPNIVGLESAVTVFEQVNSSVSMSVWLRTGVLPGIVMPAVLMAELARNGVVGWWTVPGTLLPMIAGPMVGAMVAPVPGSVVGALRSSCSNAPLDPYDQVIFFGLKGPPGGTPHGRGGPPAREPAGLSVRRREPGSRCNHARRRRRSSPGRAC
ncbi:hypothetical protein Ait01nite_066870 [Actinoplanes italicus]|uniref:Uncharacterized protein n=2 Tax=Actinoplanes italicus TaxID=113567 RepID=A0A2T0K0W1_9ACTN|nr:hypothetical protein [Actinoplanes italicus]PRX16434.1 hypothetical protein CLV67_11915 [Actinoplanes italicus]GIE33642.1 hypothetical protein Ait01nite_066870 [Actinoplanes italicus]